MNRFTTNNFPWASVAAPPVALGLAMDNSSESGVTGCRSDATRRRENASSGKRREREIERESEVLKKAAGGIARVNALSRCWSCLITSYQLKGKRRGARARESGSRKEERSEIGLWRAAKHSTVVTLNF